jgi:hypothetical protein
LFGKSLGRHLLLPGTLVLFVAAAIGVDAYRIGFFADDFIFLDAARRFSGWELLSGAHGVWPWFRPISRELYFQFVEACGSHGLAAAHTISLLVLLGIVGLLWRIGTRLLDSSTVTAAIGLFLTYNYTKFLASTASGFQDLFALFWILVALEAHMAGRRRLAMAAAFLAPLAKETGFVTVPLLVAYDQIVARNPAPRLGWLRYGLAAALALGLHLVARWSWPPSGSAVKHSRDPLQLAGSIVSAAQAFVSPAPTAPPRAETVACAVLGVVALVVLSRFKVVTPPALERPSARPRGRITPFLALAATLGALPAVAGHLLKPARALGYHVFPAAPWGSLLLALGIARLPKVVRRIAVPGLIAWNIVGSGFVALDMDSPESWSLGPVDWRWSVRLSAEARRLGDDLRRELAVRPESLVVLYEGLPAGAYFQTGDGPATRVLLGDPTVRAFHLNSPPEGVREERLAILAFDIHRLHLRTVDWSPSEILLRAMKAVIAGRGDVAAALLAFRASTDPAQFDRAYARSAATLLLGGPDRFLEDLRAAGLVDTTGSLPKELSASLSRDDPGLAAAMAAMLRAPRSAVVHSGLADSLIARDILPGAGVELRIAASLDARRFADRYRLALVMLDLGGSTEAISELEALAAEPRAGAIAEQARSLAALVRTTLPPSE